MNRILCNKAQLIDWIRQYASPAHVEPMLERARQNSRKWNACDLAERRMVLRRLSDWIDVGPNWLRIGIGRRALAEWLSGNQLSPKAINVEDD